MYFSSVLRFLQSHAVPAKDSGYSWIICLVCVMVNFFVNGFTQTIGLLFVYWLEDIGSTRAKTCKCMYVYDEALLLKSQNIHRIHLKDM